MFQENEYYDRTFQNVEFVQSELTAVDFYDCTFSKCDFSESTLKGCKFSGCTFEHCSLNLITIMDCTFSNAVFNKSKVLGVNWTEAIWPKVHSGGRLQFLDCNISYCTFIGLPLSKSRIKSCQANHVDFRETDLSQADFTYTDLAESLFENTNLSGADFSHAVNYSINPASNRIMKAKFMLPEAVSLLYSMEIELVDE